MYENFINWTAMAHDYALNEELVELGFNAMHCKGLMDQIRRGDLDNSDEFWTPSLERWIKDASLEMSVSVMVLRGIQYAPQADYEAFWKRHGLRTMEF